MDTQQLAVILTEAGTARDIVNASLLRLGYIPLQLDPAAQHGRPATSGDIAGLDLIVVEEAYAAPFRNEAIRDWRRGHAGCPVLVMLRQPETPDDLVADLEMDGILRHPLSADEIVTRLGDILHAHRAMGRLLRPAMAELALTKRVLQSVTTGITISDATRAELPLMYVNPAFEKMTGYTWAEVAYQNCRFLQGPDTQQTGLVAIREALRDQRDTMTILKNYRKDGTVFWNELYMSPLFNEEGHVTHYVGIQNDVTQRVQFGERLSFLANHDSLTGLANRGLLFEHLQQAILRASRNNTQVALLFLDLNNFKQVNDLFGHDAGDVLLQVVAERLKREVRASDTVARLGGDEFAILLPDLEDEAEVLSLRSRVDKQISGSIAVFQHVLRPSASIGSSFYPRDGRDPEELLRCADLAMYAEKYKRRQAAQDRAAAPALRGPAAA